MPSIPLNIRTTRDIALDGDTLRHIGGRMERQLKKLGSLVVRATVRFEDLNGPRGGVDTLCRLKLVLAGRQSIVIEERGVEPREAFDLAAARAQRTALRALGASRVARRRERRALPGEV